MANQDIKEIIKSAKVKQWQIADEFHITEHSLCRKLRYELSAEEKSKILDIVNKLKTNN